MSTENKPNTVPTDGSKEPYEPPTATLVALRPEERLLICCFMDKVNAPPHNCMPKGTGSDKATSKS